MVARNPTLYEHCSPPTLHIFIKYTYFAVLQMYLHTRHVFLQLLQKFCKISRLILSNSLHDCLRQFQRLHSAAMLEHLLEFEDFTSLDLKRTPASKLIAAQAATADWLTALGAPSASDVEAAEAAAFAQQAFTAVAQAAPTPKQKEALLALKTPEAVRHLTGMLTAYDWEFVEQAKELRGYTVAQILEETKHPDARIRLRALEMLGRVTEVALFTDRVEIKKTEMPDHELEARIKEKLNRFMGVVDVVDALPAPAQTPAEPAE